MKKQSALSEAMKSIFNIAVFVIVFILALVVYYKVMGDPANFQGNNPENHPMKGNLLGTIYKGGFIVPLLMTLAVVTLVFFVERYITITIAKGKGNMVNFISDIKVMVAEGKLDEAMTRCDKQKGSLANVLRAGIKRYKEMKEDKVMTKDQKIVSIQKELEEASALETPMLSKNLVILSTNSSIGVLVGLIGTVLGMIKAFSALATAGAPDSVALSTGISEALINTALGIITSTLSIIFYNVFNTMIDGITYRIDEAGFTIVQSFAANEK